jgi:short-subunit dehydrogenase
MKNFQNKTAWITGASDGIGKELALQMAALGARIILTARNVDKLNQVKDSLTGDGHIIYPMDLLKTDAIQSGCEEVLKITGGIDILVNNAGISQRSLTKDTSIDVDRKIMELDHFAKVIMTKALLPHMINRRSGHIVSISSVAGKVGVPMRSAYCAAKHAIIGFMGSLRAEVHQYGIQVLVVTPGSIKTNVSINALEGDGKAHGITDPAIENGLPVSQCAKAIVDGLLNNKSEVAVANFKESSLLRMSRYFPNYMFKVVRQMFEKNQVT